MPEKYQGLSRQPLYEVRTFKCCGRSLGGRTCTKPAVVRKESADSGFYGHTFPMYFCEDHS